MAKYPGDAGKAVRNLSREVLERIAVDEQPSKELPSHDDFERERIANE